MIQKIIKSLHTFVTEDALCEIVSWISGKNKNLKVLITRNKLSDSEFWFYDKELGEIRNQNNSFFQIRGLQQFIGEKLVLEQPVLIQDEIDHLGIIYKKI